MNLWDQKHCKFSKRIYEIIACNLNYMKEEFYFKISQTISFMKHFYNCILLFIWLLLRAFHLFFMFMWETLLLLWLNRSIDLYYVLCSVASAFFINNNSMLFVCRNLSVYLIDVQNPNTYLAIVGKNLFYFLVIFFFLLSFWIDAVCCRCCWFFNVFFLFLLF